MNRRRTSHNSCLLGLLLALLPRCPAGAVDAVAAGTLHGRVIDDATGERTTCTVRITDALGKVITASAAFGDGFRSAGEFTTRLPAGKTRVRVTRGFETRAVERFVDVLPNARSELEIRLERVVDLRRRGWFAGDSHAHMLHGERVVPVDFDAVALAARAEDLQYLSLAQAWILDTPTPETLAAELTSRSTRDCVLTWNLEAPKNYYRGDATRCLGHCWTLGVGGRTAEGDDIIRVLLAASAHDYESAKPVHANFESHRLIRAQGGAVFYTHPARWWTGPWGGQGGYPKQERARISNLAAELPLDVLIGPTFDGVDVLTGSGEFQANAMAFELWCLLLNHGYRVAGTASSDSCFDRPGGGVPGVARTYTRLDGEFSLPAVRQATAQGRTFATSGPLLLVSVDNHPPGSTLVADGNPRTLHIDAWASGTDTAGLTRLEILRNGQAVRTNLFRPAAPDFTTNVVLTERETAWYCVRVFGGDPQRQRAISGAFFLDATPHRPPAPVPATVMVELRDALTGAAVSGTVTEVSYHGTIPRPGRTHAVMGSTRLAVPGDARLRASVPGYQPVTLSPVLDHPALVEFLTRLEAADLLKWETFERVQSLLGEVNLTFRLERIPN